MGEIHGFAWQYWNSRALDLLTVLEQLWTKPFLPRSSGCSFASCKCLADLGQFSSVLVNLLCPLHNPFRDTSVSDANQTNLPNKNAVNSLLIPWSPRNYTGITGDDVNLRSCSSLQGYVQLSRVFEHELLYALSSTIIDYHQLSRKLKLPSTIINYDDRFNRAQRFAESLRMRRYSNITVPIALELSNYCSINNNTVGDG